MKPTNSTKTATRHALKAWHLQQIEKTRLNPENSHGHFAQGWRWEGLPASGSTRKHLRALERMIAKKAARGKAAKGPQ